jgi:hypothetical protein
MVRKNLLNDVSADRGRALAGKKKAPHTWYGAESYTVTDRGRLLHTRRTNPVNLRINSALANLNLSLKSL